MRMSKCLRRWRPGGSRDIGALGIGPFATRNLISSGDLANRRSQHYAAQWTAHFIVQTPARNNVQNDGWRVWSDMGWCNMTSFMLHYPPGQATRSFRRAAA